MAILSTYNFSPEIAECLDEAFERAGVNPQDVGEDHITSAMRSMKFMLNSEWSLLGIRQWMIVRATQNMSVGLSSFDLPVGAIDMVGAVLRRDARDTPMQPMSRQDYLEIADKEKNGRPDRYFADRRYNKVTVYLWERGENTTDVMVYDYFRQLSDVGAMSNTLDMPTQMMEAFIAGLAAKLAWKFNVERYQQLQLYYRGPDVNRVGGILRMATLENRERADVSVTVRHRRR